MDVLAPLCRMMFEQILTLEVLKYQIGFMPGEPTLPPCDMNDKLITADMFSGTLAMKL